MTFQNRIAVVTGSAGRIGQATAQKFAANGVKLYLADIDMERLQTFADSLKEKGADVTAVQLDVTDPEMIKSVAGEIISDAGKVDILVNNAGAWPGGSILTTDEETWESILDLNLNSVFRLSRIFAEHMAENRYGRIINLGSIAGEVGLPGFLAYSAAKAGVIMLTKTMAMELAKLGVTVNSVSPGMILDSRIPHHGTWLGNTGLGEDVANAIVFFAADESFYITGTDLPVDGGRTLGPLNPDFRG